MVDNTKRLLITGATGLLGRAVLTRFVSNPSWKVQGLSFKRSHPSCVKVDLTDSVAVLDVLNKFQPNFIAHCAAERRPDVVTNNPKDASTLNVDAVKCLADWCSKRAVEELLMIMGRAWANDNGAFLLYMSTDYVFDGTRPPYKIWDKPHPLNTYGQLKLSGEKTVEGIMNDYAILRVPILYGPAEYLGEGAVDILLKNLLNLSVPCRMSNYERRFPAHVDDVALAIETLLTKRNTDEYSVYGIYHWSGDENMTKLDMCQAMARVFGLSMDHVISEDDPPVGATTNRPYNSALDCSRLRELGMANQNTFEKGIECLRTHL